VPSHAVREVARALKPGLEKLPLFVSVSKGIEEDTLQTMSAVLTEVLGESLTERLAVLSGPSFAAEVARGLPTAVTVAAQAADVYTTCQRVFASSKFRVYTTSDVIGVEIGGAVKNVIAIAAGVSDGLAYGHSARAALITRGLVEMVRLAVRMGAEPQTLSGLSVFSLARRVAVEMPIVEQVYALLYTGKPPHQVVADLLAREVKAEFSR
jgi:glycerol-3-phosphate dehydrogenase (NAD(P)+)